MNEGSGLLWIALIITLGAGASLAAYLASGAKTYKKLARILILTDFVAVSAVFFLMIFYFLTSNMTVAYVHSHSRVDYPWYYKLAGAWSGDDGSILLWTWILSLATLLFFVERKSDSPERAWLRSLTSTILLIVLAAFIYILIVANPFSPTAPMFLVTEGEMNGRGLSPLLQTPLVIVHPPLEFASYALLSIPFAAAMAHLLTGKSYWTRISMQWTRAAWLFLTLAIIIGALWAYTVLGWGGYWAWDPVETSNLVIWVPLTALVHAQLWNRRKGKFVHLAPALAGMAFALTQFATFETRTGVIVSVHSFTSAAGGVNNDLGSRLLAVLSGGGPVPLFFVMMVVALLATAVLFMLQFVRIRLREGRMSGPMVFPPIIFIFVYLGMIIWTVFDVQGATETALGVAQTLSGGFAGLGFMILAGILIGIPLIWILLTSPAEEAPSKGIRAWINDDGAMIVGLAIFVIWALVMVVVMIRDADSLNPGAFEASLPFLLIPIGAVLFAGLTWRFFSKTWLPYVLGILVFTVLVSYALMSSNVGALYFPIVFALVFAVGLRIYRTWAPALLSKHVRVAAMLILVSMLLAFVMWSSGSAAAGLLLFPLPSSVILDVALAIVSTLGVIVLAVAISRRDIRLWIFSAVLGIALIGFLAGAIFAAVALVLIISSRHELHGGRQRKVSLTAILRGTSPQFVHLGVALLVLGYAASSYFAVENQVTADKGAPTPTSLGYQYRLMSSTGVDTNGDGLYERITANIEVSNSAGHLFDIVLEMTYRTKNEGVNYDHYLSDPLIRAGPAGDLYFTFFGFSAGTRGYSIADEPDPFTRLPPPKTDNATLGSAWFLVRYNPLVAPFWGGGWLMAIGIVVRMWSERGLYKGERLEETPRQVQETISKPPPPAVPTIVKDEDYYRQLLEKELERGGEST